ncbi:MAG: FecR domain-containing protein [Myxococcaceae bacterium]|jgi:hypothetical protein|nr:FecR domain-containing protein [Myxococcaceae bacterium]MCA3016971.1 FecR domain-containing protein [Myxococcaceae bacterium]
MNHPTLLRALVTASLALAPTARSGPDACGGVKLEAGVVRLGKPLSEPLVKTAEGRACLAEVVREVERHRLVRAVTVAALVPDAERASGRGLEAAKAIAAALVEAGLPKGRVFALAPALQRGDAPGLSLRYVERAPEDVVARVAAAGGSVFLGADERALKPAEPGMPVLVNELVKTGPNARATIAMKDGSTVEVKPESTIKLAVLQFPVGGERQVRIEVLGGGITADVKKATQLGRFEASTRVAVASVRGTRFRLGVSEDDGARLETLEGAVGVVPASDPSATPVVVSAGQGTLVSRDGRVAPPTALPEEPQPASPLKGPLGPDARLEWQAVAGAASYRVELARDADFLVDAKSATTEATSLSWPEALSKGKWFWRVTAVDAKGFSGPASRIYAFTVGR